MSALYDDDDSARDAELIAQQWVEQQEHEDAMQEVADLTRQQVRKYLVAIASARLIGEPEHDLAEALNGFVHRVLDRDDGCGTNILEKALYDAVWFGGRSVEREARSQLLDLRDAHDVAAVLEYGVQL